MSGLIETLETWGAALDGSLKASLARGSPMAILFVFAAGVITSLTPCVYPMIPVVVTYIGGSSAGTRSRAVVRSATYVLGMVVVYAVLGAIAGLTGAVFGRVTQKWYIYGVVGAIILLFGISMLGVWTVRLPGWVSSKLAAGGQRKGLAGPFLMGAASGFIAAPCTAPVLGTLLFVIAQGGNAAYGAFLLVVFALGMGLLLFLLGAFSGLIAAMPRAGRWTELIKVGFGLVMILLACFFFYRAWMLA
ncbi:MAG: cytochrome c biogenesis protein CcdA [Thermoplasmata archaeon]